MIQEDLELFEMEYRKGNITKEKYKNEIRILNNLFENQTELTKYC